MAKRARRTTARPRRPLIEELEPRLLFSADVVPLALDLPATGEAETPAAVVLDADLADTGAAEATRPQLTALPLAFEENAGQTDPGVDFLARGSGFGVFLADGDAVLSLRGEDGGHVVRLALQGAAEEPTAHAVDALESESHYLLGAQEGHVTGVTHYGAVEYSDVYDGIDVRYYGNGRQLEYDFILEPGADPEAIRLAFEGAEALAIAESGELVVTLNAAGEAIRFQAPVSYQEGAAGRESVASAYVLHEDGSVGFELGAYDASRALVIDPILDYGTYLGGTGTDVVNGVAVDASGNAYVVGDTTSLDFPTTVGPIGPNNAQDVFVSKLSPDGSSLVFSTYIGGGSADNGRGIAVDGGGNVYVTGNAYSTDFPTTGSAFDGTGDGSGSNSDAFFLKLDPTGTTLLYSTYFGGDGDDVGNAIAIDAAGNAYLTGSASDASSFSITGGVVDTSFGGSYEAYVAKFDPTQSGAASLVYSTWLGGAVGSTGNDVGNGIVVDASGRAHVTGFTVANDFPTTAGAYQTGPAAGSHDVFVSVLDPSASSLVYSTYLGGSSSDMGNAIALDAAGLVYVTGESDSLLGADFPTTAGAYQTSHGTGANDDAFVAVLDPGLSGAASLLYSTYLGGNASDQAEAIAVDAAGRVYVTGRTASSDFATSGDALDATLGGSSDAFLTVLDPAGGGGADLVYSSYLGGATSSETGHGLTLDASDDVYVVGRTASSDFSTTAGAFDEVANGGTDGFVAKFSALSNASPATLWLTTEEDVSSPSGAPGLASWAGGDVLSFTGAPAYTFEPGTTTGTFASVFNLDDFVVGNDARVDSIHYVGSAMSVGSNSIPLQVGDLLISSVFPETLVNSDTSTVGITSRDVFIYRPDTPGNYAGGGTFIPLIVGADLAMETNGITLVEQTTTVGVGGGSVTLDPGDFLFSDFNDTGKIFRLQPGVLGDSATNTGTISLLVDANNLGVNQEIHGVELIESNVALGDRTLTGGQILISTYADDTVAGTPVKREDIVILDIVDTGATTTGTAEVLFEGADVGLNTWQESVWGIAVMDTAPVLGNNSLTISEGQTVILGSGDLSTADADTTAANLSYTVSGLSGGQFEFVAAPTIAITSFTQDDVATGKVQFVHDGNEAAPAYSVSVSDGTESEGPSAATITFSNINDAPTATNLNQVVAYTEGDASVPLADIVVTEVDTGDTVTATLTLANTATGALTASSGNGETYTPGTGIWTVTGSVTNVNTALAAVAFVPATDNDVDTSITTHVEDAAATGPADGSIALNVTPVNDAPVLGANALTISEGGAVVLGPVDLAATDVDDADPFLTFTVSGVTGGFFELTTAPGIPITSFLQSDVSGGLIRFVDDGNEVAPSYSVSVSDGSLSDGPASATISYTPVNDAPVLGNNALTISEGGTVVLGAANLSATDADDADASLAFSVGGVSGGQFERVSAPGVPITSFLQSEVTAGDIQFLHDGNEAAPAYTVTVSDAAPLSDGPAAAAISFSNLNDAPTIAGAVAGQVTTDKSTRDPFTGVTIADVDLPGDVLTVDVSLDDPAKGVLIGAFTPLGGGVYRFAGNAAAATSAIQGLTFDPTENRVPVAATETTTFTIFVDDATAPVVSNANTTVITTSINDAPTASNVTLSVAENAGIGTVVGGAPASDLDPGDVLTYSISAGNALGAFAIHPATGVITVADPVPLDFEANPVFNLTIQVQDGSLATDTASVTVGLTDLGEVPVLADPPPNPDPVDDPPPSDDPEPIDEATEPPGDPAEPLAPVDGPLVGPLPSGLFLEAPRRLAGDPEPGPSRSSLGRQGSAEPTLDAEVSVAADAPLVLDGDMWRALDLMGAEMGSSAEAQAAFQRWVGSAAELGTIGLAAGFLTWFLRGGALLTSLISSMPLWGRFDPLPVLAAPGGQSGGLAGAWDEDEEERDVARILDEADRSQTQRARGSVRQSSAAKADEDLDERVHRLLDRR